MTFDKNRRNFLSGDLIRALRELLDEVRNPSPESSAVAPDYFESFETCYPLLSEAGELLMEEAARLGIDVKGKDRVEIAKEIFSRQPKGQTQ